MHAHLDLVEFVIRAAPIGSNALVVACTGIVLLRRQRGVRMSAQGIAAEAGDGAAAQERARLA